MSSTLKRRLVVAGATLAACLGAALLVAQLAGPKPPQTPAKAVVGISAPSVTAAGPQDAACTALKGMVFDVSSQDAEKKTQDSLEAVLDTLPMHDPLGADLLAVDQNMVSANTDLMGMSYGNAASGQQYADDTVSAQSDLGIVSQDCGAYGKSFRVNLIAKP